MIVIDIEASGTEAHKHSIVSLGALELEQPENRIYLECRIWDGAHVMEEALKRNGFTEVEINDPEKITEAELVEQFDDWANKIGERTFVGQNVSFDRQFLRAAYERAGLNWEFAFRSIDTHTLAYMHHVIHGIPVPEEKGHSGLDLNKVLNYVGIPDEPDPHNALTGALCHAEVASRLLYNRQLLPEFEQHPIPWEK